MSEVEHLLAVQNETGESLHRDADKQVLYRVDIVDPRLYLVDSFAQVIYGYEFDRAAGAIANQSVFAQIPEDSGMPDGLTVESEGHVWIGHWRGWHIARYDPGGKFERKIWLPAPNVTSLIFGGADLDELYITSARYLLDDEARMSPPLAGDLLWVRPGVRGLRESEFGG